MTTRVSWTPAWAMAALLSRCTLQQVSNGLRPLNNLIHSGIKKVRKNSAFFSLWILFPFSLVMTSDWIGLLVVFQALAAAVRLRNLPAARALAAIHAGTCTCEGKRGAL